MLAFGAFLLYAALTLFATVADAEVQEMGKLTMFLIAALLPSDAGILLRPRAVPPRRSTPQPGIAQLKKV